MGWPRHPANRSAGQSSPAHHNCSQVSSSKILIVRLFIAYSTEWFGGWPRSSDRQSALVPEWPRFFYRYRWWKGIFLGSNWLRFLAATIIVPLKPYERAEHSSRLMGFKGCINAKTRRARETASLRCNAAIRLAETMISPLGEGTKEGLVLHSLKHECHPARIGLAVNSVPNNARG